LAGVNAPSNNERGKSDGRNDRAERGRSMLRPYKSKPYSQEPHGGKDESMKTNYEPGPQAGKRWKFKGWMVGGIALVSFAIGSLLTARLTPVNHVRADGNRVFQLMVYHTVPGKVPALESIFRDVSKLQAKHNLDVVGYWVPNDEPAWANTFVYIVAHPNRDDAKKNWDALHADPDFPEYRKAAAPLIERDGEGYKVDEVFMRPTDFSAMK
jgi:hypothetical protein